VAGPAGGTGATGATGISRALQVAAADIVVTNADTPVSPDLVLSPGRYLLSAKLYVVSDPTDEPAVVACALAGAASGVLDSTETFVPRNRSAPLVLTATLEVPDQGDSVTVVCSTPAVATPTAMSVKLIALQVGELG
jgi:hypothetical protein